MRKFSAGTKCEYRTYGGQLVTAHVRKKWLFLRLIEWQVHDSDYDYVYVTVKWRPVWRLL